MSVADPSILHLNLDDAWQLNADLPTLDFRGWGPRLRFSAPAPEIERFAAEALPQVTSFLIYGSGDFHHLTAVWLRRLSHPVTVISFDNHPDWDIRPPRWACGGWVNRALELPQVDKVSVWGCGNFECWWPARIFGNNLAERAGRMEVHPWADDRSASEQKRRGAILLGNWQQKFADFARQLREAEIYVTIDLDCLRLEEAVTNWESGRFVIADLKWAVGMLRSSCRMVGADVCGAWSAPAYARRKQRFVSQLDHPRITLPDAAEIQRRNRNALRELLPLLSQRDQDHPGADQE